MNFTNHNILLPDGQTRPGEPLTASLPAVQTPLKLAQLLCPAPASVVDLGCNEGAFAVEFARAGYDVLGIDARQPHIDHCDYARERLSLENLRFACDDARNINGTFDIVLCFGLLYHLDEPAAYLRHLGQITSRLLLLNAHYALPHGTPPYGLSETVEHEGLSGRWYSEPPGPLSAWQNTRSFWIDKTDLLWMIGEAGFSTALETTDCFDLTYAEQHWRGLFVGAK